MYDEFSCVTCKANAGKLESVDGRYLVLIVEEAMRISNYILSMYNGLPNSLQQMSGPLRQEASQ